MNECQCVNGVGAVGPVEYDGLLCPNHEDFVCISCDAGHHLDTENTNIMCPINLCQCNNGIGFTGTQSGFLKFLKLL